MINKVNNLNEKSFKNYSGPDKEFKQKTVYLDKNIRAEIDKIHQYVNEKEGEDMEENNKKCLEIIEKLNLTPRIESHEPILNYETAEKVDKELNFNGHETKSLFLKGKSGKYYIFITLMEERMDSKLLKNLVGEKVSLVSGEEMTQLTGMEPGCMTPFGLKDGLIEAIVVDPKIYQEEKLILAFGTSRMSMEITAKELKTLLEYCHKTIIMLEEKTGEE